MKLQKVVAPALAAVLGVSLAAPASAASGTSAQEKLEQVTRKVKSVLEIGDEYTQFYGEPNQTMLGTKWQLNWSAGDKELNVTAGEDGKVVSYSRNDPATEEWERSFGPSFPDLTQEQARQTAEAFLRKVLSDGEQAVFRSEQESGKSLGNIRYGFGGGVALNGVPTPMGFRIWVDVDTGEVSSFWRDDESDYVGSVPAADTTTTASAARALLRDRLDLELVYVRDGDSNRAVLRYLPRQTDEFYVDAATGSLVNLTELQKAMSREHGAASAGSVANTEMAADAGEEKFSVAGAPLPSLSPAEQAGAAKLEGTLTQEELDAKVRLWKALKLDGFQLSSCNYHVERADPDVPASSEPAAVFATLSYAQKTDQSVARRTVTVDARTGALESMSGYDPYQEGPVKVSEQEAQTIAGDFLSELWGEQYAKTERYNFDAAEILSEGHRFTFSQKANGYFFPANSIQVRVSADTGAILGFGKDFDDDVTFDSTADLISLDDAKTAWSDTYPVELAYIAVPVELKLLGNEAMPLINAGWSYYHSLKPGYAFGEAEVSYQGVDAKTGKPVKSEEYQRETISYSDLSGHWAKSALEELAEYGVGWNDGKADPDGNLTQLSYLALLASSDGYRYLPDEGKNAADELYAYAIRRGLISQGQRNDAKILNRGEMVQMMLDSLGFRTVANLKGIYQCSFADAAEIPAELTGYAALSQGLGLIHGDGGSFAAARTATRAEAAVMLWQYMKR